MAELVYILCALTSLVCASLLVRGYRRSRTQLLMWSALCFLCLAASNTVLVIDLVLTPPTIDLLALRMTIGLVGLVMLVHGLIWEGA